MHYKLQSDLCAVRIVGRGISLKANLTFSIYVDGFLFLPIFCEMLLCIRHSRESKSGKSSYPTMVENNFYLIVNFRLRKRGTFLLVTCLVVEPSVKLFLVLFLARVDLFIGD